MSKNKNPCAKKVPPEQAYEVYSDGEWTYYVLKKYQTPEKEKDNLFALWYCMTISPMTPKGEYGDAYVSTVLRGTQKIANPLVPSGTVRLYPQEDEHCVTCGGEATWCLIGFHYCYGCLPKESL